MVFFNGVAGIRIFGAFRVSMDGSFPFFSFAIAGLVLGSSDDDDMISFPLSFCFPVWRHCVLLFSPGVERFSRYPSI